MHIFLVASIHGKKKYQANYQRLVELVKANGHKIEASHILESDSESIRQTDDEGLGKRFRQTMTKIKQADAVFAELSYTSTSAGYYVATAVALGKPVVIFYSGDEEPHLLRSLEATNDKLVVVRYKKVENLDQEVKLMIEFINDAQDTRFNFFVSPTISSYLDWVAKNKRIPRSVYLRKLIDQDMDENEEYQGV